MAKVVFASSELLREERLRKGLKPLGLENSSICWGRGGWGGGCYEYRNVENNSIDDVAFEESVRKKQCHKKGTITIQSHKTHKTMD